LAKQATSYPLFISLKIQAFKNPFTSVAQLPIQQRPMDKQTRLKKAEIPGSLKCSTISAGM
jgi:hypothetical protein